MNKFDNVILQGVFMQALICFKHSFNKIERELLCTILWFKLLKFHSPGVGNARPRGNMWPP